MTTQTHTHIATVFLSIGVCNQSWR